MKLLVYTVNRHVGGCTFAALQSVRVCVFLTDVLDNVVDGGLEEFVHGFLCQPQHPLGRPLHYVHTGTRTEERV